MSLPRAIQRDTEAWYDKCEAEGLCTECGGPLDEWGCHYCAQIDAQEKEATYHMGRYEELKREEI